MHWQSQDRENRGPSGQDRRRTVASDDAATTASEGALQEIIFEVRWALPPANRGAGAPDPGFESSLARLFERLRDDYPKLVSLPAARVPPSRSPHAVRHQFRSPGRSWPLVQIGPGVLTLNDTGSSQWTKFGTRLRRVVDELFNTDSMDGRPLLAVALRYLHGVPLERIETPLLQLVRERLHTSLAIDPALFEDPADAEKPSGLNLSVCFPLKGGGQATLALSTVRDRQGPRLLWQLEAARLGEHVPGDAESIGHWAETAHGVLQHWSDTLDAGV